MGKHVKQTRGARIFVGLSGGVDSALSAALLLREGNDVIGVFIKGWYPPGIPCTGAADRRDAMRVAAHLHIPFVTLDASTEYKASVIDYLLSEYKKGRTPNPDIMCNRDVKFGVFYRYAREHGGALATGHYARTKEGRLFRAEDQQKDQSYFLWAVPQEALAATRFPLGALKKEEVRKRARSFGIPVALKKDSQGICFLGEISVDDYLRSEFGTETGKAFDTEGKEIGTHDGALLYTLGERVALTSSVPGPWYVIRKDIARNELVVSHSRVGERPQQLSVTYEHWFRIPEDGMRYTAEYRYHGPRIEGIYDSNQKIFMPINPLPEPAAEGQSLVLSEGEEILGGGILVQ